MVEKRTVEESSLDVSARQLALVDRIIGLEAEVARLSIEGAIRDIRILHKSRPWQIGRFILAPAVLARRLLRRG